MGWNLNVNTVKYYIFSFFLILFSSGVCAQKITLGTCILKDGGHYKGEMVNGKAQGKGSAVYPNGDTYEGEYVKGKRQGYYPLLQLPFLQR